MALRLFLSPNCRPQVYHYFCYYYIGLLYSFLLPQIDESTLHLPPLFLEKNNSNYFKKEQLFFNFIESASLYFFLQLFSTMPHKRSLMNQCIIRPKNKINPFNNLIFILNQNYSYLMVLNKFKLQVGSKL